MSIPLETVALDFRAQPLIGRESGLLLPVARSSCGFTGLYQLGRSGFTWRNLFRPFLRVHRSKPTVARGEPDLCTLENEGVRIQTAYVAPEGLLVAVDCETEDWLYLGPAGDHENFGGMIEQEFLIYFGFSARQSQADDAVLVRATDAAAACAAPAGRLERHGGGWRIRLQPGRNRLAVATGWNNETDEELLGRARKLRDADFDAAIETNRRFWHELFTARPLPVQLHLRDAAKRALWSIESSTLAPGGNFRQPALAAGKPGYGNGMWLWDTCFAIRGYAPYRPQRCRQWLEEFMRTQTEAGRLSGCLNPSNIGEATQVPLFTWAANAVYAAAPDREFLAQTYAAAAHSHEWWTSQADPELGLPATGPISYDNSPLYDACRVKGMDAQQLVNPDIIAALVNDATELAKMAAALGDPAAESRWRRRRDELAARGHAKLYDPADEFYYSHQAGRPVKLRIGPALTALAFAPPEVARKLAEKYLRPGSALWPRRGVATVFTDDPAYDADNFWRGMIWGSTNRLLVDALDRAGLRDSADRLTAETIDLLAAGPTFYEVYNPETGEGRRATIMSGFGAGVLLDLLARDREHRI